MKKTILSLSLATILIGCSFQSAFAQGTPAFPAVWKQSETPDFIMPGSSDRTVDGTWTWDAARKQATAKWSNGAMATINVVTDDGTTVVMCRYDTTGSAVGMVADYVGVRKGNTISGKVFWRDPLRDKQRSGKWTATFATPSIDLTATWTIQASPKTAFGTEFTDPKAFRLEKTAPDKFSNPRSSNARILFVKEKNELQFINNAGINAASAKVDVDPKSGQIQRIVWSDGSVFTRTATLPAIDLTGEWTNEVDAGKAEPLFDGPTKTFRLEKAAPGIFRVPGFDNTAPVRIVNDEPVLCSRSGVNLATAKVERDPKTGAVVRIRWEGTRGTAAGSTWTRKR